MGIGPKNLIRIQDLCERGLLPPGAHVLELGAQEIHCAGAEQVVRDFIGTFCRLRKRGWNATMPADDEIAVLAVKSFSARLFRICGFRYQAFDIFDGDGVVLFDLNLHTVPEELAGAFDLVTNFGTTEHVINQLLAMRTLHHLTRQGGVMYHDLPLSGYHTHGYFSYNPLFFQHLAEANSYDILYQGYSRTSVQSPAPEFMTRNGYSAAGWTDCGIEFVLRKTVDRPFRMPLETGTSLGLNQAVWDRDKYGLNWISGWDLQRELLRRYVRRLKGLVSKASGKSGIG